MTKHDPPRLVIASRNAGKLREIRELLAPHAVDVVSVGDFPDVPEVVEDGQSFAENAAKKATETARRISEWALGEDSGLVVNALAAHRGNLFGPLQRTGRDRRIEQCQAPRGTGGHSRRAPRRSLRL